MQSANTTLFVPSDQRRPCTLVDHSCEPQTQLIEQQILQNRPTTDRQPNDPLQWQFHSTYDQPLAYFLSEPGIIALKYLMRLCSVHCNAVRFADHLTKVIVNSNSDRWNCPLITFETVGPICQTSTFAQLLQDLCHAKIFFSTNRLIDPKVHTERHDATTELSDDAPLCKSMTRKEGLA